MRSMAGRSTFNRFNEQVAGVAPDPPQRRKGPGPRPKARLDVIDAALIEFGKRGFDGTTTSMIADRAGSQQPYIYALFENKRHLFLACQETLYARMLDIFRSAVNAED
ncbi:MAG: helix-turn-helix transcriptional regulator [Solirubrobacterales bacterium]|nr:helix-turn-helix transcriptional regulator [Solirubrobacterales bacterium]